jgi:hypothetical protein
MRNLLLVSALLKYGFVFEDFSEIRRTVNQDVPLRPEKQFDRPMRSKRFVDVFLEDILLVNVFEERDEDNPKRNGGNIERVLRRQKKNEVSCSEEQNPQNETLANQPQHCCIC